MINHYFIHCNHNLHTQKKYSYKKYYSFVLVVMLVFAVVTGCTPSQTRYASEPLESIKASYASILPASEIDYFGIPKTEKERESEIDRYSQMLEQEYHFSAPVTILLIVPPIQPYGWWGWDRYDIKRHNIDSLITMIFNNLENKLRESGYVNEIKMASSIFRFSTLDNLQELAARHRADECLLLSYDLLLTHPRFCLGFWPASYLIGDFTMEIILIDTRTGFILMSKKYTCVKRSDFTMVMTSNRQLEVIRQIVPEVIDTVTTDLVQFYEKEEAR